LNLEDTVRVLLREGSSDAKRKYRPKVGIKGYVRQMGKIHVLYIIGWAYVICCIHAHERHYKLQFAMPCLDAS